MTEPSNDVLPVVLARAIGRPGVGVNYWGILKKDRTGKWKRCRHPDPSGTHVESWPLAELSTETILERWGEGEFRTEWFVVDPDAEEATDRFKGAGTGRPFALDAPAPAPAPPPVVAAPSFQRPNIPGLGDAMALLEFADQRNNQSMLTTIRMAELLTGNRASSDMTPMFQLMLTQQKESFERQLDQQRTMFESQIRRLTERASEDEDEDDTLTGVARAAAPIFKAGKPIGDGLKAALANYVVENPKTVIDLIKSVPAIVAAIQQQGAAPPTEPPQHAPPLLHGEHPTGATPPASRARPIAKVSPPPRPPGGLNEFMADKAKEEKAEKARAVEPAAE